MSQELLKIAINVNKIYFKLYLTLKQIIIMIFLCLNFALIFTRNYYKLFQTVYIKCMHHHGTKKTPSMNFVTE